MKRYHIITFGCQMNEHDSENIAGMLESMGYVLADDPFKAEVVASIYYINESLVLMKPL